MSGRTETVHVRGEGGAVIAMDLPLPEPIADRLARGQLVLVNADGTPRTGTVVVTSAQEARGDAAPQEATGSGRDRPAQNAPKSTWIAHVVSLGLLSAEDAEALTKADLIDLADSNGG